MWMDAAQRIGLRGVAQSSRRCSKRA